MSHGRDPDLLELADPRVAEQVSETMHALAAPSRLRILSCLYQAPSSVGELSVAVGMEASAVSHQLRVLRHLGLVVGERDGRRVVYRRHDEHGGELLAEARSRAEPLSLALAGATARLPARV